MWRVRDRQVGGRLRGEALVELQVITTEAEVSAISGGAAVDAEEIVGRVDPHDQRGRCRRCDREDDPEDAKPQALERRRFSLHGRILWLAAAGHAGRGLPPESRFSKQRIARSMALPPALPDGCAARERFAFASRGCLGPESGSLDRPRSPPEAAVFWCWRGVSPSPAASRLCCDLAPGTAQRLWMSIAGSSAGDA